MSTIPGKVGNAREGMRRHRRLFVRLALLCLIALANLGCTRAYYHDYADNDVYGILKERLFDWRWKVPERPVEADPRSRMADLNDPNHVPIVPDEVAARRFQVSSRFPFEYHGWKKRGTTPIEDLSWQPYVPTESDGKVLLSRESIMRLGMVNSRDYQYAYENVYLAALSLTLARFQFMIQGYSNWGAFYSPLAGGGVVLNSPVASTASSTSSSSTTSSSTSSSSTSSTSGSSTSGSSTSGSSTSGSSTSSTGATTAVASTANRSTGSLNNQFQIAAQNGFLLNLMSGGQLLVNLANSLVFEYSNHNVQVVSPNLTISFIQPLLRGAWARIVTQALSLQERQVLYTLRSFAEFRRQFYVALVTGQGGAQYLSASGYLSLIASLQSIRNQELNVQSTRRNLEIYEEEVKSGIRAILDRDTIAQQYQSAQATLLLQQASLQTQLDGFKISLGLPTELEVRIDDSALDQFELNDTRIDKIRSSSEVLFLKLLQNDELTRTALGEAGRELKFAYDELEKVHDQALTEYGLWQAKLESVGKKGFDGPEAKHNQEIWDRETFLAGEVRKILNESDQEIDNDQDSLANYLAKLDSTTPLEATKALRDLIGKQFRARLSEVSVTQTQIRVFSIVLRPIDLTVNQAIQVALGNRLDLQNALAQVTDAWRNVEVDANALQGFLNFVYNGSFNEAPRHAGLFRFDASANIQTFGLQFDAPINRRAERNQYRADQIQYQRARRAYMLARDQVVQQIRLDMRQLVLQRRTFEINREQVIIAARQLEQAEYNLRTVTDASQNLTYLLLQALQSVLSARNALITTWVSYETARMSLYRDFDLMDIDANGVWTNENDPTAIDIALRNAQSAPAFSLDIPARIPDLRPNVGSDSTFYIDVEPGGKPNQVPDAATDPFDEGPLRSRELGDNPVPGGGGGAGPPPSPPRTPSPFANGRQAP